VHLAGQAARGAHADHLAAKGPLHRSDHLRVRWQLGIAGGGVGVGHLDPIGAGLPGAGRPVCRSGPLAEVGREFFQPDLCVRDQRQGLVLGGVKDLRVEADDCLSAFWNSAQEPVVKSCNRVPTASSRSASSLNGVGGTRAGDTHRTHVQFIEEGQR
jgi:hypothetical protein